MWSIVRTRRGTVRLGLIAAIVCTVFAVALFAAPRVAQLASHETVILVTGFEPFGSHKVNSSWEIVRRLEGRKINGHRVVTLKLPVAWDTAWAPVKAAIDQYQPGLVINVGQGSLNLLELAQSARNIQGKTIDNNGVRPASDTITPGGPDHYTTPLDLTAIQKHATVSGIVPVVSPFAGSFLCNFVSYHSYEYLTSTYPQTVTFFVHVPAVASNDAPDDQQKLNQLTEALQLIVEAASQQTSGLATS